MAGRQVWTTADHWATQLDSKNMLAEKLAPLMVPVLRAEESTRQAGDILAAWNFMDEKDQAAPLIYQSILRHYARAAVDMLAELVPLYGADLSRWLWGDEHTITFSHPLVPGDLAAEWIGGGTHPLHGSGETLNRAAYKYGDPYRTTFFDSMRLVMDLSDPDKIEAHIPGGVSERLFNEQMTNGLADWLSGTPDYWWFSDEAIAEHAVSELVLTP